MNIPFTIIDNGNSFILKMKEFIKINKENLSITYEDIFLNPCKKSANKYEKESWEMVNFSIEKSFIAFDLPSKDHLIKIPLKEKAILYKKINDKISFCLFIFDRHTKIKMRRNCVWKGSINLIIKDEILDGTDNNGSNLV